MHRKEVEMLSLTILTSYLRTDIHKGPRNTSKGERRFMRAHSSITSLTTSHIAVEKL